MPQYSVQPKWSAIRAQAVYFRQSYSRMRQHRFSPKEYFHNSPESTPRFGRMMTDHTYRTNVSCRAHIYLPAITAAYCVYVLHSITHTGQSGWADLISYYVQR